MTSFLKIALALAALYSASAIDNNFEALLKHEKALGLHEKAITHLADSDGDLLDPEDRDLIGGPAPAAAGSFGGAGSGAINGGTTAVPGTGGGNAGAGGANPCAPVTAAPVTNPCAPAPAPTPAPVYTTVTTTPYVTTPAVTYTYTPAATYTTTPAATYTTTPAATYTTTPAATYTVTPAATYTTTPAGTYTATPAPTLMPCTTVAPAPAPAVNPCAPAVKISDNKGKITENKGMPLIQRMTETPIAFGLFALLLVSAAIGLVVRAARRRGSRLSFTGRTMSFGAYDNVTSDLENNNEALVELEPEAEVLVE